MTDREQMTPEECPECGGPLFYDDQLHRLAALEAENARLREALDRLARLNPGSIASDAAKRALEGGDVTPSRREGGRGVTAAGDGLTARQPERPRSSHAASGSAPLSALGIDGCSRADCPYPPCRRAREALEGLAG